MSEFVKYPSLKRFGVRDVEGIGNGLCHVFPKLDGTNASVWLENGEIQAGSRKRHLDETSDGDNAGFCKFAKADERLQEFFKDFPHLRLYGEWLVPHTIKNYEDDAWRKFYIFDVWSDTDERFLPYEAYKMLLDTYYLDYIPCLFTVENPTKEVLERRLPTNTFLMKDGAGMGEGLVVKNYDYVNKFGRVVWAKLISNEFKANHTKTMGAVHVEVKESVEEKIIEEFCTEAFIEKEYAKMTLNEEWHNKRIGELLGRVWHEFLAEESVNFILKHKHPVIDFKRLNNLLIKKVKEVKSDLFYC